MTDRVEEIRSLLRRREAAKVAHPGGTLAAHLERVRERLAGHAAREALQLAGLGHAIYGTDGFALQLVTTDHRRAIQNMIGSEAELIIYRYGATDRTRTWPSLAAKGQIWDRFESSVETLDPDELRDMADLSIVNELDVLEQSPETAEKYGAHLANLFASWRPIASPAVTDDAETVFKHLLGQRGTAHTTDHRTSN